MGNEIKIDNFNYILVIFFGLASWISINSIWVELPIFVNKLPESWSLPSYFSIIIQFGNFSTVIFAVYNLKLWKYCNRQRNNPKIISHNNDNINQQGSFFSKNDSHEGERLAIYFMLFLQLTACISVIFKWSNTHYLANAEHSVSLFILVFFLALANCSSNVLFLPYLIRFPSASYVTAYYVGSGLSGFIPSVISLSQGLGGTPRCRKNYSLNTKSYDYNSNSHDLFVNVTSHTEGRFSLIPEPLKPRFGVTTFFSIIIFMLVTSIAAFYSLNLNCLVRRRFKLPQNITKSDVTLVASAASAVNDDKISCNSGSNNTIEKSEFSLLAARLPVQDPPKSDQDSHNYLPSLNNELKPSSLLTSPVQRPKHALLGLKAIDFRHDLACLVILSWISALASGIIPSIQSYATLPYGNMTFHLTVSLGSLASPLTSFLAFFYPSKVVFASLFRFLNCGSRNTRQITSSTNSVWTTYVGYYVLALTCTALSSFIIAMAIRSPNPVLVGRVSGSFITILVWVTVDGLFSYFKVCLASEFHGKGKKWLLWYGIATQLGSSLGAFTIFLMINVFKLFRSGRICDAV